MPPSGEPEHHHREHSEARDAILSLWDPSSTSVDQVFKFLAYLEREHSDLLRAIPLRPGTTPWQEVRTMLDIFGAWRRESTDSV